MTTLRDALSEALSKAETGTLEAPQEVSIEADAPQDAALTTETSEQREDRLRDERGRFAAKQAEAEAKPTAAPAPAVADPVASQPEPRKAPSSWPKQYWDKFTALPPDVQELLEKREADYAKGVSTYKQQWDSVAPLQQAIQPFLPDLQQHGIRPDQWIENLGNAHRTLAMGSPEQKLQMFAKLATDYGVPLQAITGQQVDPQFAHVTQTVSSLQREIENFKAQQQQTEQARLQGEIQAFQANAPHFEAVKQTMAGLLQYGVASDLKTAYEKAIRLDDVLWQQHQAEQAQKAEAERRAALAQKKAAAVSPKSSSPTGAMATSGGKKGLRDQLSEAFDNVAGGRF